MIVEELLSVFGIEYNDKGGALADKRVEGLTSKWKALAPIVAKAAGTLGVGLGAAGVVKLIKDTADLGDNLDKTAGKLGVATAELQEMRYAGELSGVSVDKMDVSLKTFNKSLAEASRGQGEAVKSFALLGIQLKDSNGQVRATSSVMDDVADRMAAIEDPATRVQVAMKVFGESGVDMINMLKGGSSALQQMREEAHATGGVMSQELIDESVKLTDNMLRWRMAMQGLRNTLALSLVPAANRFVETTIDWVKRGREFIARSDRLRSSLRFLGDLLKSDALRWGLVSVGILKTTAALRKLLPLLARLAWPVTLVIALVAAVDDLHALFSGGKSLIGAWLDELGGIGTAQLVVDSLRDGWDLLNQEIDSSIDTLAEWGAAAREWLGETWDDVKNSGEAFMSWLEDTFGEGFVDTVRAAGNAALDALIYPFRRAAEMLGDVFGFSVEDLDKALKASTFNELRTRQYAAGEGLTAGMLAGPSFGQANRDQLRAAAVASVPVRAGRRAAQVHQRNQTSIVVQGSNDPRATAEEVRRQLAAQQEREREDAFEALAGDEDEGD